MVASLEVFFEMGPEHVPPKWAWNTSHLSCAEGGWQRLLLSRRISDYDNFDGRVFQNGPGTRPTEMDPAYVPLVMCGGRVEGSEMVSCCFFV